MKQRILCALGWHAWTKWTLVDRFAIHAASHGEQVGTLSVQQRECTCCGLQQHKRQRVGV